MKVESSRKKLEKSSSNKF